MPASPGRRAWLASELLVLFGIGPAALWLMPVRGLVIPILLLVAAGVLVVLLTDRTFDRRLLWGRTGLRREAPRICIQFAIAAAAIAGAIQLTRPDLSFAFIRGNPRVWAVVMVLYPLLSAYPQELVYRTFLFHRYQPLLRGRAALFAASAAAFGWAHVILDNWLAVGMSTLGGVLFAWTYSRSRSTAAAWFEHSLYGCMVFTVGLGAFFYGGRLRVL
ncbi:MAG: CPBP family intramembrane metalloprotease [Phycisphaeraceae bacterium]|nr:CPBP family intramembrane metalloprotease [Phycisphaeraceae bacterium]